MTTVSAVGDAFEKYRSDFEDSNVLHQKVASILTGNGESLQNPKGRKSTMILCFRQKKLMVV